MLFTEAYLVGAWHAQFFLAPIPSKRLLCYAGYIYKCISVPGLLSMIEDTEFFLCALRLKRAERVERQQEQLRKLNIDMEEWRKELTVFRQEVTLAFHFPIIEFLLSVYP